MQISLKEEATYSVCVCVYDELWKENETIQPRCILMMTAPESDTCR